MKVRFLAVVSVCIWCAQAIAAPLSSYHIGNSLTVDSQPLGIAALAAERGEPLTIGYHAKSASSLNNIWTHPDDFNLIYPHDSGGFTSSLPGDTWSAVTLQPHYGDSLEACTTVFGDFVNLACQNPANASAQFFIYSPWPQRPDDYQTKWDAAVADEASTAFTPSRQYYDHLYWRIKSATSVSVFMIPVGEVLYELDQRMRAGDVPGYTDVDELYRDDVHMGPVGRFIAGVTTYATMYGEDPMGLVRPDDYFGDAAYSPELYAVLEDTIWDVVSTNPYTGVRKPGDFNEDGAVDVLDINAYVTAVVDLPTYAAAHPRLRLDTVDLNHDGIINLLDINGFVADITASGSGQQLAPEPTIGAIGVVALCVCGIRRRRRL